MDLVFLVQMISKHKSKSKTKRVLTLIKNTFLRFSLSHFSFFFFFENTFRRMLKGWSIVPVKAGGGEHPVGGESEDEVGLRVPDPPHVRHVTKGPGGGMTDCAAGTNSRQN